MPTMTDDVQAEATRAEIRRHALDLFSHYGFQKTNIGDIAQRCGMSPGNLYRFYKNKQAIGLAVIRDYFNLVEAAMDLALVEAGDDPETRIRAFLETGVGQLVDELERTPKIVELAEFLCEDDEGWALLGEHIGWKHQRLMAELRRGVDAGVFACEDFEVTASAMLQSLKAFWMPMTLAAWRDRATIMPEMRAIVDLMFRGVFAR